jgi:formylglycine-generating enzyme required for sulfatase activity
MNFCRWDGGRTLPTRSEWLLASKGPVPNNPTYPWGEESTSSELVVVGNYYDYKQAVDLMNAGVSYYGIYSLLGNVEEWGYDSWIANFVPSILNPYITDPEGEKCHNGASYTVSNFYSYLYWSEKPNVGNNHIGFRCARRFIHNLNPQGN